jgi:hypothetical protein
MVGASKAECYSNGFALLTTAPGGRWLQADELKTCVLQDRLTPLGLTGALRPGTGLRGAGPCQVAGQAAKPKYKTIQKPSK